MVNVFTRRSVGVPDLRHVLGLDRIGPWQPQTLASALERADLLVLAHGVHPSVLSAMRDLLPMIEAEVVRGLVVATVGGATWHPVAWRRKVSGVARDADSWRASLRIADLGSAAPRPAAHRYEPTTSARRRAVTAM